MMQSADLPSEAIPVVLTPALIRAGRYAKGTFNRAQLEAIGITWKDRSRKGWIQRNAGRVVTAEQYARFLELRKDVLAPSLFPLAAGEAQF